MMIHIIIFHIFTLWWYAGNNASGVGDTGHWKSPCVRHLGPRESDGSKNKKEWKEFSKIKRGSRKSKNASAHNSQRAAFC